ncbi:MAG: 5-formyltetrahydrofolate cyclo-ligase [Chroococcales cyanobacterium]
MIEKTQKAELRRQLLTKRRSLPQSIWREKSDRLCHALNSFLLGTDATTILAYFSFRQEPDLTPLFSSPKYRFGFPRCVAKSLSWHCWKPGEAYQTGLYGIFEPSPDSPVLHPEEVDLILVPAVACDARGYRLGYGGGFYDRMLSLPEWSGKPTIGILFDFAYLPQLPIDPWDKPLTGICTESGFQWLK